MNYCVDCVNCYSVRTNPYSYFDEPEYKLNCYLDCPTSEEDETDCEYWRES